MENEAGSKIESDMEVNTQNTEKNRLNNESDNRVEFKNKNESHKAAELMQKPEIDSDRFFKLIDSSIKGLKEYRLIVSALELGVFEVLKAPLSAAALAEKFGCDPALMPHFCEALCSLGLLDRLEEKVFEEEGNTQKSPGAVYRVSGLSSTYLLESSPFSQQHYLAGSLRTVELWNRLPEIMKNGPDFFEKGTFLKKLLSLWLKTHAVECFRRL